ncbi:MAG TPA: SAM-dependent methyltransferase [Blastocatellia bacterium]|nr:SAM-dependent methyltransferase [Blastocatellia bacterium]
MEAALYDSDHGYYKTARPKIGPEGDYYTSSNVHPAFGAVLANTFVELWNELLADQGPRFLRIVELGAGTGRLAQDILTTLRNQDPKAFSGIDYVIVESSPEMIRRESELLSDFERQVRWSTLEELERAPSSAIFFSNELVDAMPVHRVRFIDRAIEEQYVTAADERLGLSWAGPSSPKLMNYFERAGVRLAEGQIAEINLDAIQWLRQVSRAIERGFLVTIDYGDLAPLLYAGDRRQGTLRSFYNHCLIDLPIERVGEQDMTASVNFTALIDYGRGFGLETVGYERQVAFLVRMGLIDMIAKNGDMSVSRKALTERLALKNLFVPGGVSDNFRVLIQKKTQRTDSPTG